MYRTSLKMRTQALQSLAEQRIGEFNKPYNATVGYDKGWYLIFSDYPEERNQLTADYNAAKAYIKNLIQ